MGSQQVFTTQPFEITAFGENFTKMIIDLGRDIFQTICSAAMIDYDNDMPYTIINYGDRKIGYRVIYFNNNENIIIASDSIVNIYIRKNYPLPQDLVSFDFICSSGLVIPQNIIRVLEEIAKDIDENTQPFDREDNCPY